MTAELLNVPSWILSDSQTHNPLCLHLPPDQVLLALREVARTSRESSDF